MHPAFSVIFLTTLIGVGQGLFLALYTGQLYSVIKVLPVQESATFYGLGSLIALVFLAAGPGGVIRDRVEAEVSPSFEFRVCR